MTTAKWDTGQLVWQFHLHLELTVTLPRRRGKYSSVLVKRSFFMLASSFGTFERCRRDSCFVLFLLVQSNPRSCD